MDFVLTFSSQFDMKLAKYVFPLVLCVTISSSIAATHVITFAGIAYSPNTLQVAVGDVIRWEGDFTMHPLESVLVPEGAATFGNTSGTSFEYTVLVEGSYGYRCAVHWPQGMVGGFQAAVASVDDPLAVDKVLQLWAYPNPTNATLSLSYRLEQSGNVRVLLFDMNGRELLHVPGFALAGENSMRIHVASLTVGAYYYRLETPAGVLTRKFTIAR